MIRKCFICHKELSAHGHNHVNICAKSMQLTKDEIRFKYIQYNFPEISTHDILYELYITKLNSLPDIQKLYGIDFKSICFLLTYYKIPIRNHSNAGKLSQVKIQKTCLTKYGAINVLSKGTLPYNKRNETVQIRYGVDNVRKDPDVIKTIKQSLNAWRLKNNIHSATGMIHSAETKALMRKKSIEYIEKCSGKCVPHYNRSACQHFDQLAKQTGTQIQHAENGGEFHIKDLGYWVDGYDAENNIVYEFDEKHHFRNGELRPKDIQRQTEIEQHLNCKFIRIKESELI